MRGARISFAGTSLVADPSGALFWPETATVVVADLHLEKGSHFARRGRLLPPYDTAETLARLTVVLRHYRPKRVVALGDSFHDRDAVGRLAAIDAERLRRLVDAHDWVWVAGNHDAESPAEIGGAVCNHLELSGLSLRHAPGEGGEAEDGEAEDSRGRLYGHFHPKAAVATRGGRISASCFVSDGRSLILPAFGAYTGGLDVFHPEIMGLFGRRRFRVLMRVGERLHFFTADRLLRPTTEEREEAAAASGA